MIIAPATRENRCQHRFQFTPFRNRSRVQFSIDVVVDLTTSRIQLNHLLLHCTAWISGHRLTSLTARCEWMEQQHSWRRKRRRRYPILLILSKTIRPREMSDLHLCDELKCDRVVDAWNRSNAMQCCCFLLIFFLFSTCSENALRCTHDELFVPLQKLLVLSLSFFLSVCLIWLRTSANLADEARTSQRDVFRLYGCICICANRTHTLVSGAIAYEMEKEDGARWRSFKSGIRDAFGGVKRDTCICKWRPFAAPLTVQWITSTAIERQSTQSGRIECGIAINKQNFCELEPNKMEKQEQLVANPRRNILRMAVANILTETGFGKADKQCVESLTEVRYH